MVLSSARAIFLTALFRHALLLVGIYAVVSGDTCKIPGKLTYEFFHHALEHSDDTSTGHLPNATTYRP